MHFSTDVLKIESPPPSTPNSEFLHLTQRSCALSNTYISSLNENVPSCHRFWTPKPLYSSTCLNTCTRNESRGKKNYPHAPPPSVQLRLGRPDAVKRSPQSVHSPEERSYCDGIVYVPFMPRKRRISILIDMEAKDGWSVVTNCFTNIKYIRCSYIYIILKSHHLLYDCDIIIAWLPSYMK